MQEMWEELSMIISEKQIMQLMQAIQTMAFRYALEGKEEEASGLFKYLKVISDQQSAELKEIK